MASRTLHVAVCGSTELTGPIATALNDTVAGTLGTNDDGLQIAINAHPAPPDEEIARAHHLVITTGTHGDPWSDVSLSSSAAAHRLATERLIPWLQRWQQGRRAPRAQTAVLAEPDPEWRWNAARLIARLSAHTADQSVLRIDHIGSTSVPGLRAKNLIDIQIIVPDDGHAEPVAKAATGAGFVHVNHDLFGKDRIGNLHPEHVCVDADPGRPVNINIRSAERPVARDALLFRDWLRANQNARAHYLAMKSELAGGQIDDYGDGKEPFISAALDEAETWAVQTDWPG